ncbi:MAG: hypothetical protein K2Y18_02115 [Alphaproteobacteria bacterium]|nr:hypothetical protein [Alphaproteobacteria bacterium]
MIFKRVVYTVIWVYFLGIVSIIANDEPMTDRLRVCKKACLKANKECMRTITMRSNTILGGDWIKKYAPGIAQKKANEIENMEKTTPEGSHEKWAVTSTETTTIFEFQKNNALGLKRKFELSNQTLTEDCTSALTDCKKKCVENTFDR